jgi:hypothetical protein
MATIYLNLKTSEGIETIDELNENDFNTYKEFRTELKRLLSEYRTASNYYSGIYTSTRSTKDWRNKN